MKLLSPIVLVTVCLVGSPVWAQSALSRPAASAPSTDTRTKECNATIDTIQAEVRAMVDLGRKEGNVLSENEDLIKTTLATFEKHKEKYSKGGLTVSECRDLTGESRDEKNRVTRMIANNKSTSKCRADVDVVQKETVAILEKARKDGGLTPAEDVQIKNTLTAGEARSKKLRSNATGITREVCDDLYTQAREEKSEAQSLAGKRGEKLSVLGKCLKELDTTLSKLLANVEKGKANKKLDAKEVARAESLTAKFKLHKEKMAKNGIDMNECNRLSTELHEDVAKVKAMM